MFYNRLGGGAGSAKELLNASGSKIADLESRGSGKVSVVGGLGNTPPEKVLQGSIYSDESGVRRTGTMEDITPDLNTQSDLIKEIRAMLVGRVTEANATPEDILKGKKAYVGEKLVEGTLSLKPIKADLRLENIPYNINNGSAVVLNGEIHILGGYGDELEHYKYDGSKWVSVSTLPYEFYQGSAVVLNGEIHILGTAKTSKKKLHYKYDGSKWTSVSTLPEDFYDGSAVVFNNEIHILGGYSYRTDHYKWNGSTWKSVSTLPYEFYKGSAVVLNGEIHILGGATSSKNHYKYDGSTWKSVSILPYNLTYGSAIVFNDEIQILGGNDTVRDKRYKFSNSAWTELPILPLELNEGIACTLDGSIYVGKYSNFFEIQKTLYERG